GHVSELGDLAYTSKRAREMLDQAGLPDVQIIASNDLDENIILNLKAQGAKVDVWGIGTQLIAAADQPSLGGVYKLVAREQDGEYEPVIKVSGNPEKITNPGIKEVYRIINRETGKAEADYIALQDDQEVQSGEPIQLHDPIHPYRNRTVRNYEGIRLLRPIFRNGELVYSLPALEGIRRYHEGELSLFWPEYLRKL